MKLAQVGGRVRARRIRRHPFTLLGPSLLLLTALPAHAQAGGAALGLARSSRTNARRDPPAGPAGSCTSSKSLPPIEPAPSILVLRP